MADFEQIDTRADLESLANDLMREKIVAFDTEADSFYHYYDKICLIQVATRRQIYLIDPIALGGADELAPLGPVLASPEICKLFHAAEYDIFVLKRDCGFRFANLFDTMISAQLLGYPSVGLAALTERHFGISLPKDEQRSDWSIRPLRPRQLNYAAADVAYLIQLAEKLAKELRKAKRMEWAEEEFQLLTQRQWPERAFDKLGYLRIKGARRLDSGDLAVLRELYLVRDKRARDADRPPFKVLGNRTLLEIAERQPRSTKELAEIKGITDLIIRRFGNDVLNAIARGRKKKHGPIPKLNGTTRRRMDRPTEHRVAVLKKWRSKRARELELDPGVLCPNSALEVIAWKCPATPDALGELAETKGWFARAFGDEVIAALQLEGETEGETSAEPTPKAKAKKH